jgi:hypothetical protein
VHVLEGAEFGPILADGQRRPEQAVVSHFRPVVDIAKIVVMVAWRLLKKGLYPQGLWRSLKPAPVLAAPHEAASQRRT